MSDHEWFLVMAGFLAGALYMHIWARVDRWLGKWEKRLGVTGKCKTCRDTKEVQGKYTDGTYSRELIPCPDCPPKESE